MKPWPLLLVATLATAQTPSEPAASEPPAAAASEPQVAPPPPPPSCAQLSSRALSADLKAATAQSQSQPLEVQVKLYDAAVSGWEQALATCEGRARERAQRNLADSQRTREQLAEKLGAGSQCETAHRDATALQELARTAFGERRWPEAAALYRKAEGMWDLAAEQCTGSQQQTANKRREQSEIDAHNAESCAPPFDRAREFSTKLRNQGAALPLAERQTQSQIGETLWRDTARLCKGAAAELALNNAAALARERGTPWVSTPLPGAPPAAPAPTALATAAKPAAAGPGTAGKVAASALATTATTTATTTAAAAPTLSAPPPAARPAAAPAAPEPAPEAAKLFDMRAGDTRYLGQFVREEGQVVSGTGRVEWSNGDVYEGPLLKGQRQGVGEIRWASGQRYKGEWQADKATGQGLMVFANGNQFEGSLIDGQPEGEGELRYASGDVYKGQIRQGLPHGKGVYRWVSGQRYDGDWVNDKPQGRGEMRFANGNVYTGQMAAGQPQGEGRMVFVSGDVYEGQFVAGKAEGRGRYAWKSGERYEGEWARGLKHGKGVFSWPSGDRWEGVFKDDEKTDDGELLRK